MQAGVERGRMVRKILPGLLISLMTIFGCLVVAEIGVRVLGETDENGNFFIGDRKLKPYRLPVQEVSANVEILLDPDSGATTVYDPYLGWTKKANSSKEGGYSYNSAGIRSAPAEYPLSPRQGVLRIAIFGDSFTHGDEVSFEGTWGYLLERKLNEAGLAAEVLNFGLPGGGMDQAYLRWLGQGKDYSPDLVILGFQAENVSRNVNLMRPLRSQGGMIFSKPRFVLDGEGLRLINSPTVPLEELPQTVEDLAEWDLVEYEYFFDPEDYAGSLLLKSRLAALVLSLMEFTPASVEREQLEMYSLEAEPAQVTIRLIQAFARDVEGSGGSFLMVHLPVQGSLARLMENRPLPYQDLVAKLDREHSLIFPDQDLVAAARAGSIESLFQQVHYSAPANEIISQALADYILAVNPVE